MQNNLLKILICDPEALFVETPKAAWVVLGAGASEKECFRRRVTADNEGAETFCRSLFDATVIKVALAQDRPAEVTIWRGISSPCVVFYGIRKNGDVILADYFPNLLAQLSLEERVTPDAAAVDHYLFRTVPGAGTYCANVKRVGYGERLMIGLNTGATDSLQFDRVAVALPQDNVAAYVKGIDAALDTVMTPLCGETGTTNLFSGGVDSVLIQSYLGGQVPAIYVTREGIGHAYEQDYASHAARILGVELQEISYNTSNYLEDLAVVTKDIGAPIKLLQWPFFRSAVTQPYGKLIIGVYGDALFGVGVKTARIAGLFASQPGEVALKLARPLVDLIPRLNNLESVAAQLRRVVGDPYGYAGQSDMTGNLNLAEAAFGTNLVRDRLAKRFDYVLDRATAPCDDVSSFYRHLELAHWAEYFCDDVHFQFRQLGLAHGKAVSAPFHTYAMQTAAARIPTKHRYLKGLQGKYLLKNLLKSRVPDYPVDQRKGASLLPLAALHKDSTLSEVWERYDPPAWCDGDLKARAMDPRDGLSRSAITWAVWEREVLRNPDLRTLRTTRELSWTP